MVDLYADVACWVRTCELDDLSILELKLAAGLDTHINLASGEFGEGADAALEVFLLTLDDESEVWGEGCSVHSGDEDVTWLHLWIGHNVVWTLLDEWPNTGVEQSRLDLVCRNTGRVNSGKFYTGALAVVHNDNAKHFASLATYDLLDGAADRAYELNLWVKFVCKEHVAGLHGFTGLDDYLWSRTDEIIGHEGNLVGRLHADEFLLCCCSQVDVQTFVKLN